jgi:hypothetical protein
MDITTNKINTNQSRKIRMLQIIYRFNFHVAFAFNYVEEMGNIFKGRSLSHISPKILNQIFDHFEQRSGDLSHAMVVTAFGVGNTTKPFYMLMTHVMLTCRSIINQNIRK